MAPILLTGFDAFGGLPDNPSERLVQATAAAWQGPVPLHTEILPTVYRQAEARLVELLDVLAPRAIVLLGVARGRSEVQLERVALNLDDSEQADNCAEQRRGARILDDGPVAYWSTLDLERWLATFAEHEVAASISNHAGTFLCNHVFYTAQAELERRGRQVPCGFVHVPGNVDSEGGPSTALLVQALTACLVGQPTAG